MLPVAGGGAWIEEDPNHRDSVVSHREPLRDRYRDRWCGENKVVDLEHVLALCAHDVAAHAFHIGRDLFEPCQRIFDVRSVSMESGATAIEVRTNCTDHMDTATSPTSEESPQDRCQKKCKTGQDHTGYYFAPHRIIPKIAEAIP